MKKSFVAATLLASVLLVSCWPASSSVGPRVSTVSKSVESPSFGPASAKVDVRVFSDFQCPACQRFHELIEPKLREYAESGKISLSYKNYPLPQHQNAEGDALASLCSLPSGKYLEYSNGLYLLEKAKMNADVSDAERNEIARVVGVENLDEFSACLSEGWYLDRISQDKKEADALGLNHTPSVYFNGKIVDFSSVEQFFSILDATISSAQ